MVRRSGTKLTETDMLMSMQPHHMKVTDPTLPLEFIPSIVPHSSHTIKFVYARSLIPTGTFVPIFR